MIICGIANLLLGAIWYSPAMFYKTWKKESHLSDEQLKASNPARIYGISFILSILISYNMAFFLADPGTTMAWGTTAGFLTGLGFCALIFAVVGLFELRSWKYIAINGGYMIVYFTLIGFILGSWR